MDIARTYDEVILWISDSTNASDALLHVHAGLAVLLLARLITRQSLATPIPFTVVVLAEMANEVMDRVNYGQWLWPDTGLDILNTLFWPFILMVGLRIRRAQAGRHVAVPPPAQCSCSAGS